MKVKVILNMNMSYDEIMTWLWWDYYMLITHPCWLIRHNMNIWNMIMSYDGVMIWNMMLLLDMIYKVNRWNMTRSMGIWLLLWVMIYKIMAKLVHLVSLSTRWRSIGWMVIQRGCDVFARDWCISRSEKVISHWLPNPMMSLALIE